MEYYPVCLCHHGVKGMKWGIRKSRKKSNAISRFARSTNKKAEAFSAKVNSMSDSELANSTRRLNLENQYIEQYNRRQAYDKVVLVDSAIKQLERANKAVGGIARLVISGRQITDTLGFTSKDDEDNKKKKKK